MKRLEKKVIGYMRMAIANFDTDHALVRENSSLAHELWSDHHHEWSEAFCILYNQMLAIFRAHTPQEKGRYRTTHVGIGYSSFPVTKWIPDKVQPPVPTAEELVARFDQLIVKYTSRHIRQPKRSHDPVQ